MYITLALSILRFCCTYFPAQSWKISENFCTLLRAGILRQVTLSSLGLYAVFVSLHCLSQFTLFCLGYTAFVSLHCLPYVHYLPQVTIFVCAVFLRLHCPPQVKSLPQATLPSLVYTVFLKLHCLPQFTLPSLVYTPFLRLHCLPQDTVHLRLQFLCLVTHCFLGYTAFVRLQCVPQIELPSLGYIAFDRFQCLPQVATFSSAYTSFVRIRCLTLPSLRYTALLGKSHGVMGWGVGGNQDTLGMRQSRRTLCWIVLNVAIETVSILV